MTTLHIHFDESGDCTPSRTGSRYFVLTAAWTLDPKPLADALTALRFTLLRAGLDIEAFHASPDSLDTRDRVLREMAAHRRWGFSAVLLDKHDLVRPLDTSRVYTVFATLLMKRAFSWGVSGGIRRVQVFADTLPFATHAKRDGVMHAVRRACARHAPRGTVAHGFAHRRESNAWIQVADYCNWSVQRKWEQGDSRAYDGLRQRLVAPELLARAV